MRLYKSKSTQEAEEALEREQDWDDIYQELFWDDLFLKHRKDLEDLMKRAVCFGEERSEVVRETRQKWIELHEAAIARMRETSL